jgi:DNA-binding NarL/FixJ family response regulator
MIGSSAIKVFLVEDEPPAMRKLERMLVAEPDLEVCGRASTCADAI